MDSGWITHKETLRRLYLVEDKTRDEVMAEMRRLYDFEADAGKFDQWLAVSRRVEKRKREDGKESELRIDGILVPEKKLRKALTRYVESTATKLSRLVEQNRRSQTPEGLCISTPAADPGHLSDNLPWLQSQQAIYSECERYGMTLWSPV
ncbi:hypothetical protein B0J12DRAFT_739942 [Macrophomina phaseolina]|uniref:Clr5 domain-containing protein n=1 Tax=Macrophomina phaseolina TaxID=35725 RepID=A0ABQ8GB98_9PEZI|nr:hypothetical protein B0J12DRAFT_739942 [Macrophomina phaseolina]